jgi:hypothetical protein
MLDQIPHDDQESYLLSIDSEHRDLDASFNNRSSMDSVQVHRSRQRILLERRDGCMVEVRN